MYREICQMDLSEFHSTVWEKSPKVSKKINFTMLYDNYCYIFIENFPQKFSPCNMYRGIFQMDLSEFHSTVREKSPKVSKKYILLSCMAIIAIFL